jgi:hypothetical protein
MCTQPCPATAANFGLKLQSVTNSTGSATFYCSAATAPNSDTVALAATCYAALAPPPPRVDTSSGFCR